MTSSSSHSSCTRRLADHLPHSHSGLTSYDPITDTVYMYVEGSDEETKVKTTLVPGQEVVVALPHCAQGIQRCKLYNALPLSTQELAQECSISFELNNSSYLMEKPQHLLWRSMPFKGNHGVESLGFDFEAGSILGKSISISGAC